MSSRFEADGPEITALSITLVGVLAVASFSLSFVGLIQTAAWAGIPEQLRWLVPVVVDSTILVYAIAATVQRARGENTVLAWTAVGFFTLISVGANAGHVLAPEGVALQLSPGLIFGAVLASIMPISLFFATHTTVQLVVAPVRGSVAARQRRAAKKLSLAQGGSNGRDSLGTAGSVAVGTRLGTSSGTPVGTLGTSKKSRAKADPKTVLELHGQNLSQRDIADRLGVSKSQVNRIVSDPEKYLALSS